MLLGILVKSDYRLGFSFCQRKDEAFTAVNSTFLPLWLINRNTQVSQQAVTMVIGNEGMTKGRFKKKKKRQRSKAKTEVKSRAKGRAMS